MDAINSKQEELFMSYLYLSIAIWLTYIVACTGRGAASTIFIKFPAIAFSVTFGILSAKSFGLL